MNRRFIEAFVSVAQTRSFRAAAGKLKTTQTAISARIASLESNVGDVRLVERDKRRVTLTRSGDELLKHSEELLSYRRAHDGGGRRSHPCRNLDQFVGR